MTNKTISMLYNIMLTTTNNRNVIRQGGLSCSVDSYNYSQIEIAAGSSVTLSNSNFLLISTDTPFELQNPSGWAINITSFMATDSSLLNFILANSGSSTATVVLISC